MAPKKSSGSGQSASSGAVTARAKTSIGKNKKITKTAKQSKAAATAKVGEVAKGGSKKLKSGAGAIKVGPMVEKVSVERVPIERVAVEQLRVEKVPVTGRLIKLGAVDRDDARVLEEVITGAGEVTITAGPGTGKSTTLTGVLLGVLRTVTDALEHGEAVTIVGEQTQEGLAGAAISSQKAADTPQRRLRRTSADSAVRGAGGHCAGRRVHRRGLLNGGPGKGRGSRRAGCPGAPGRGPGCQHPHSGWPADLFLSCADVRVFRPVWQAEIENEVVRNTARLTVERHDLDPDFPVRSRPAGVAVMKPDRFLRDRLTSQPQLMVAAVEGMSARLAA